MLLQLGNAAPHACVVDPTTETTAHDHAADGRSEPIVTYMSIPDAYSFDPKANVKDLALHLARARNGVTKLPENEAFLAVVNPLGGMWDHHSADTPLWVWSDNPAFGKLIGGFFGCDVGRPADVEDTHNTQFGPPGVGPQAGPLAPTMLKVNAGNDIQSALLGGGQVDFTGQATAATATTLTRTGSTWTTNQWAGCRVYASVSATQMVWGLVVSNTATVLTVDRWYTVDTPGGAAGTTPSGTATFVIVGAGGPAAWFMGISANTTTPVAGDTSLTGEITTAGGGLVRKICPYAHTAGVASYTLTPVFTANGTDALPVTIGSIAVFNSMVVADTTSTMLFRTLVSPTATLSASGDQLTITETVTE